VTGAFLEPARPFFNRQQPRLAGDHGRGSAPPRARGATGDIGLMPWSYCGVSLITGGPSSGDYLWNASRCFLIGPLAAFALGCRRCAGLAVVAGGPLILGRGCCKATGRRGTGARRGLLAVPCMRCFRSHERGPRTRYLRRSTPSGAFLDPSGQLLAGGRAGRRPTQSGGLRAGG